MKKHLSTKSIITAAILGALITPMFAFALPCVRAPSSPSGLKDLKALMTRFR